MELYSYAFLANYRSLSDCLQAVYAQEAAGAFNANAAILTQLRLLESQSLNKIYKLALQILNKIDGVYTELGGGDFAEADFSLLNFYTGEDQAVAAGDFERVSFYNKDFNTGADSNNNWPYVTLFQTLLAIFQVFQERLEELSDLDRDNLETAMLAFLENFDRLQEVLTGYGLNPCMPSSFNNSTSLFLQAAGSDRTNDLPEGIHLRWGFTGALGQHHLPQGDQGITATGATYQQPNDWIRVYRTPYLNPARVRLDFETARPAVDHARQRWTYTLSTVWGDQGFDNRVRLTFKDEELYRRTALLINPAEHPAAFLTQYSGVLEIEIVNKEAFAAALGLGLAAGQATGTVKFDVFSSAESGLALHIRKTFQVPSGGQEEQFMGDNMRLIRLVSQPGAYLRSFAFETYHEFVHTRSESAWEPVGPGFGLSLDDAVVYERLESVAYPVDGQWPEFNGGARVKVANYQDKWSVSRVNDPSIRETVEKYLMLSATNPRAEEEVKDADAPAEVPGIIVSYLDVLNLMSLDYHIARMLGLGHIDVLPGVATDLPYVYKMEYVNRTSPESALPTQYTYVSLPTAKQDLRLPETPALRPVTYGLPVDNQLNMTMFDPQGYAAAANVRVVNIGREPFAYEVARDEGLLDLTLAENFNLFEQTKSVLYGVEYRPDHQADYVRPEITTEKADGYTYYSYDDTSANGVPETTPVPDQADSLYIHFEQQEGIHHYAIYGINWFSRASAISEEVATDATQFPVRNQLLPPSDLAVQYVQPEDTLLFTTATEQSWLSARAAVSPGQNVNFTRVNFNWLDVTDISYLKDVSTISTSVVKASAVQLYSRQQQPAEVTGVISAVSSVPGNEKQLIVQTGSYRLLDGTLQLPAFDEDPAAFLGSQLVTGQGRFTVTAIDPQGDFSIITLEKNLVTSSVEDGSLPGTYAIAEQYVSPQVGERFTLVENLGLKANWSALSHQIQLMDLGSSMTPLIEETTDAQGNTTRYWVGGLTGRATVMPLRDVSSPDAELMPGYYAVQFAPEVSLPAHPQDVLPSANNLPAPASRAPYVDWYKGLIRLPAGESGEKKLLEVIRIQQSDTLTLYVYDPAYAEEEVQLSAAETDWINGVNFHPGYKAYVFAEPDAAFDDRTIEPQNEQLVKKTLIGLQTVARTGTPTELASRISLPAILMARKVEVPKQPGELLTYGLRVRPDVTGKAAFTFDSRIEADQAGMLRLPFGYMFYRTTHEDVLHALYQPATISRIGNELAALSHDPYYEQRYAELVNLILDPATSTFKVFEASPAPYGFPQPDREGLIAAGDSVEIRLVKYQAAIRKTLLPLTAQTPICAFIKPGYQTDNKRPQLKTIDGQLLTPADAEFDPFPMIRTYTRNDAPGATFLRFTDYSLNASSRQLYFYTCAEVTSTLATGELSPFAGPVTVIHTLPASAPRIRSHTVQLDATSAASPIAVQFQLSPFNPEEPITKIRIYRTYDPAFAASLQSMDSYQEKLILNDGFTGIEVIDDLADLQPLPFGKTVYFRLAYVRSIINEKQQPEEVLGLGSAAVDIRLMDTTNPASPELHYDEQHRNLTWLSTASNSTYHLYQLNQRGNWQRIQSQQAETANALMSYSLPGTQAFYDETGSRVYYRYKVMVENSSGLRSLTGKELTV